MTKFFTRKHFLTASLTLILLQAILLTPSCTKPEIVPSYIHIDSIGLHTLPLQDGTNSHNICDAWVYVDNQLVGAFELPATIPVPYSGQHTLEIQAGIKENGIAASREAYPFYSIWSTPVNLVPAAKQVIKPTVGYVPDCEPMDWREDFESSGISLIDTINSDLRLVKDTLHPFEGRVCGSVYMTQSNQNHFQCQSSIDFYRPGAAPDVYLEINYKCNNKFFVGLINSSNSASIPYITFNITDTWKKMYVRLTDVLDGIPIGGPYKIYFGMDRDPLVPNPEMHIDNIKLIH